MKETSVVGTLTKNHRHVRLLLMEDAKGMPITSFQKLLATSNV